MTKVTEKELIRLLHEINDFRVRSGRNPLYLGKLTLSRKLQNRHKFFLKCLHLNGDNTGTMQQMTANMSGQALGSFLQGILEGIKIGMKVAIITETPNHICKCGGCE
jgi:hypothetical protein